MNLTILSADDNLCRVQCSGEINYEVLPAGKEPLFQVVGPQGYARKVLLNLEKVPHIDSVGVGWLVRCHKHFQDGGGILVLYAAREAVRQVFELLNLASILHVADTEAAARALALAPSR
jgi:anti-anti-sigma factor